MEDHTSGEAVVCWQARDTPFVKDDASSCLLKFEIIASRYDNPESSDQLKL